MTSHARASELVTIIQTQADTDGDDKVLVTKDLHRIPSAAPRGVICLVAPRWDMTDGFDDAELDWTILLVAGPAADYDAAWARLDALLKLVLRTGLPIDDAVPETFTNRVQGGEQNWPAYLLTFTETLLNTRSTP